MKPTYFNQVSEFTLTQLTALVDSIEKEKSVSQKNMIKQYSPFSNEINQSISTYEELLFYCSLKLSEAIVTRRSLIRNIDPDLFVTCKGKTNLELMRGGKSPYAFDEEDSIIELHHLGQDPNAPFAELTHDEHMKYRNSRKLHTNTNESWRNKPDSEKIFAKERACYWRKRAKGEVAIICTSSPLPVVYSKDWAIANSVGLMDFMARLYAESSCEDLLFMSESARMQAYFKELGARSLSDFAQQSRNIEQATCPYCQSFDFASNGTYTSNGEKRQRYICNVCGRTFTLMQKSIISESNLSFATWISLIVCLYHGISVAETARICNISEKSVQNNRLRLFYALKILDENIKLRGKIVIDETYFAVSFKGNHSESKDFSMNRKPHKRGSEVHTRGLSKEQVCVVCALDEYENAIAHVAGVGAPNAYRIWYALNGSIDKNDVVCLFSDMNPAIRKYANDNGMPIKQTKSKKNKRKSYTPAAIEKAHWLQKINSFHSKLTRFMSKFAGISSDMLYGYMCLFTWIYRNRDRDPVDAYRELFSIMVQPNLYKPLYEIAMLPCFCDVTVPKKKGTKKSIRKLKRAKAIFAKYASGVPVIKISKQHKISRARVYQIIEKIKELGYGYKTEKEKLREDELYLPAPHPIPRVHKTSERNKLIYEEKMAWKGSKKDFYIEMTRKYGLSKQTIMNIVSEEKRIIALSDNITVLHTFEYRELNEIYQTIYNDYLAGVTNKMPKMALIDDLASKYGYSVSNIQRIIGIMKADNSSGGKKYKKKASHDVVNRDKELFVALLNWTGTKAEKYNLSSDYIRTIIVLHYKANPMRYRMIHP